jgi:small-conductance mechanosensitive channel
VLGGGKILVNRYRDRNQRGPIGRYRRWAISSLVMVVVCWAIAVSSGMAQTADEGDAATEPQAPPTASELIPDTPVTKPFQQLAPPDVKAIFQNKPADTQSAPVYLDGRSVFKVANTSGMAATERAEEIEERLERIASNFKAPGSLEGLEVASILDGQSNQPVVSVNGEHLMTVTYSDAQLSDSSLTARASQITSDVEDALWDFNRERQPDYLWQQVRWTMATLLITLLSSFAIAYFRHTISQRRQVLRQGQYSTATREADGLVGPAASNNIRFTFLTRQKINSLTVLKQFLRLLQIVLWLTSGLLILGYFPYTRWLQPLVIGVMRLPLRFGLIVLVAYGLIRFLGIWIDRLFLVFQSRTAATLERSQRLILRLSTFSQVIKGIIAFVIGSIAFLVMLGLLGVNIAPLLAGAGLLGFAVSFASQSLIKDIINGFLVLLEDQYGVGDVITIKGMSGFVENMNLRITQLRATDGQLITIPNGQIDIVQNLSKEWSRVDLMIPVGLDADINQALHLVETVANTMRQEEIWGALILEPPLLLGVDELSHAGATIRIWIKTLPMRQWDVAREYRRRLKIAFEEAHIPVGIPQQVVYVSNPSAPSRVGRSQPETSNGIPLDRPESTPANTP